MGTTTIILVRHGETDWNKEKIFRGRIDVPLNEKGLMQARRTAAALREIPLKAVYSSPLARAHATAEAIAEARGLAVIKDEAFNDPSFGLWEGRPVAEVAREYPEEFRNWQEAPHLWQPPGGESLASVRERSWRRLLELSREYAGETLAIVSHRVVLKLLILSALGLDESKFWMIAQSPCAINVLACTGESFTVNRINETCHLESLAEAIFKGDH
ncbi:MAG: histidine phosphatase family protein [Firmicutes bacterium]|nr:histidine phosphatase family protein [Bacillota bacterium]HPU00666.1 histidine phosphatase family protein [Bacillota bacterium]